MQNKNNRYILIAILSGFGLLIACVCLAAMGVMGISFLAGPLSEQLGVDLYSFSPTSTPEVLRPTPENSPVGVNEQGAETVTQETIKTLEKAIVPINDLYDLADRLEGKENIPTTVNPPAGELIPGAQSVFWVSNVDSNENFQVSATLRYVTPHHYFWIQDGVDFDQEELRNLSETFETRIYPVTRAFFGSEWTPGVDGDPHLYILYAEGVGYSLAGYFSSADEYHPLAHEYSNAHEMFLLNADNVDLGDEFAYSVLAHEFQHMIHWNRDRNETSWINEGFSELSAFLNGYEVGSDYIYIRDPDIQLNDWPNNESSTLPHYGASFLFLNYFLNRFGQESTQALVGDQANGIESVDEVLKQIRATDTLTGKPIRANDLIQDWLVTSFLMDGTVADGRFIYENYPDAPQADETETLSRCPVDWRTRDVSQYGVDYIRIRCRGSYSLSFEGSTMAKVVPADPYSGKYAFWSNQGDESDMVLTREFDFSQHDGPLTLTYWTWYDLEDDYDYAYLVVSENGDDWEIITTPSGTAEDPSGNSFGWGYNGSTSGWIQEKIDLSQFAGKKIWLRFEYVTDAAVNGEGMLLDDIAIPEIGYFENFETEAGGWEAAGWVQIQNILPQTYRLALITYGAEPTVAYIPLKDDSTAEVNFEVGGEVDEVVLVVTGTTRYTRQKAAYRFEVKP
jgi:immune inhibitor A